MGFFCSQKRGAVKAPTRHAQTLYVVSKASPASAGCNIKNLIFPRLSLSQSSPGVWYPVLQPEIQQWKQNWSLATSTAQTGLNSLTQVRLNSEPWSTGSDRRCRALWPTGLISCFSSQRCSQKKCQHVLNSGAFLIIRVRKLKPCAPTSSSEPRS